MTEKKLLLVDGSSYLYRAYHAMPDLRSPDGFPTGAIHGIVAMMRWLRERYPAEHAVCVAPGTQYLANPQGEFVRLLTPESGEAGVPVTWKA